MPQPVRLIFAFLLLWSSTAFAQGQRINGDRTVEGGFNAGTATGAVNTYALTLNPAMNAYVDRQCFLFKANLANTSTTPTLNVNGLGAKTLQKRVAGVATALAVGDIGLGQYVYACYDGTVMQVMSLGGGGGSGGGDALVANPLSQFAATTSAQLAAVLSDEVGATGGFLRSGGNAATATALAVDPTACGAGLFVTDIAANGTLTCATPAGGGNVSNSGSPTVGLTAEWLTPTSLIGVANSGSGLYVKQTNATLITPTLGVATATSLNKLIITAPATSATLTITDGKTLTASNTMIQTATDGSTIAFGTGGTVAYRSGTPTTGQLATWANGTAAQGVTALPAANMPVVTGDVTFPGASTVSTLANIPSGVPMAGSLLATAIAAPGTPAAGKVIAWADSTSKNWAAKGDTGVVNHGVQSITCGASSFILSINDAGLPVCGAAPGAPARLQYDFSKSVTSGTPSPVVSMTLASGSSVGVELTYSAWVENSSQAQQYEAGRVVCYLNDVAGVRTGNTCIKSGNSQVVTAGTLQVDWAISAAAPAVVSVTVTTSLTPSATFPLVLIPVAVNMGNQAYAMVP